MFLRRRYRSRLPFSLRCKEPESYHHSQRMLLPQELRFGLPPCMLSLQLLVYDHVSCWLPLLLPVFQDDRVSSRVLPAAPLVSSNPLKQLPSELHQDSIQASPLHLHRESSIYPSGPGNQLPASPVHEYLRTKASPLRCNLRSSDKLSSNPPLSNRRSRTECAVHD